MSEMIIKGGERLHGEVTVQGAKNSVLPILAASLLAGGEVVLHNCPDLKDVDSAIDILVHLGCRVEREGTSIRIDPSGGCRSEVPDNLMREMRSSVIFLGAILSKTGYARMSFPGGCELGPRPIDLHIDALRKLGVDIVEEGSHLTCRAGSLRAADIHLRFPSVGATENSILASCMCEGTTRIYNAAREPEIEDLQRFLCAIGCQVRGAGGYMIEVEGRAVTTGAEHTVIADRIAAGTYLCVAAATRSRLTVTHMVPAHVRTLLEALEGAGCGLDIAGDQITIDATHPLRAAPPVVTLPYPGFATDLQAPLMASLLCARGVTVFEETIFENRYRHVAELRRMGADIRVEGRWAYVHGVETLQGARVTATDLRGGGALVVAALGAQGESRISAVHHIDRGYAHLEELLRGVGADICRA